MGTITSGVGLISGINTADIIDQLMKIEAQPVTKLQTRVDDANKQKIALTDLSTRLTTIRLSATTLKKPSTLGAAETTSSNESVLTATPAPGAVAGNYQFQVAQLVGTQQSVSAGFSDATTARVGAGNVTIELGDAGLSTQTDLASLNGGAGVRRGVFRITDRGGHSTTIDTTSAVTLDDVVKKINTSLDVSVKASVQGDHIVLADLTGATTGALTVQDTGNGHAAADLGITNTAATTGGTVTASAITGADINSLGRATLLSSLNDGRGVRTSGSGDLAINVGGTTVNVSLANVTTVGDAIDAINAAAPTQVQASITPGANGITLTDLTGSGTLAVTDGTGSHAATDLGLTTAATGSTITGKDLIAGLDTVLLGSLNGGAGLNLGSIQVTDRAGHSAAVDLSGAKSVQDVLDAISNANTNGLAVTASLNAAGNGIQITDDTGGGANLVIGEVGAGTSAADLGLAGSFTAAQPAAVGKNLQRQWLSGTSQLSALNGGKGIAEGDFKIKASNGVAATITVAAATTVKLQDVIDQINQKNIGVTASINAHGDGLLLTDTAGGTGTLSVEDSGSTTAADLNIAGAAATGTTFIDGSWEETIAVSATDTLTTLQKKISDLNFGVQAQIINDGSAGAGYRLSITAKNSGLDGQFVFDSGTTKLAASKIVSAQNAAIFMGGTDTEHPLLVTSSSNQITNLIPGVTVELHGVSSSPVNLTVSKTPDKTIDTINSLLEDFNDMIDQMDTYTKLNTDDPSQNGVLFGDSTVQQIQDEIYTSLNTVVSGAGKYKVLASVGLTIGDGGKLQFDEDKFRTAYATDPDSVTALFTKSGTQTTLTRTTSLSSLRSGKGIRKAGTADDLKITSGAGTFTVKLGTANTIGDVVDAINAASGGAVTASVNTDTNGITLTATSGTVGVSDLNNSQAAEDLGLAAGTANGATLDGKNIITSSQVSGNVGAGFTIEAAITKLIDPVDGVITRENATLDSQTAGFQDRISQLNDLLTSKRARLETQFANMETVLANLQSQQSSISQISSISTSNNK